MQRLRIKFSRGEEIKYISHLDLMRMWERALHRAEIPLAYSEGFSPHPKISLAAPLSLGVTSEAELMDIFLNQRVLPHFLIQAVSAQLPLGVDILKVEEISPRLPSLQSQLRYIEYRVEVETSKKAEDVQASLHSLLRAEHLPWHHSRDTGEHHYDLRALIDDLWLIEWHHSLCILGMRLHSDSSGTGRPEQVLAALGFFHYPKSTHRTCLILADSMPPTQMKQRKEKLPGRNRMRGH
jgi:radical SAM-linked protein